MKPEPTRGLPPPHIIEDARKDGFVLVSVASEKTRIAPRNIQRAAAADPEFANFRWKKWGRWLFVHLKEVQAFYPGWERE